MPKRGGHGYRLWQNNSEVFTTLVIEWNHDIFLVCCNLHFFSFCCTMLLVKWWSNLYVYYLFVLYYHHPFNLTMPLFYRKWGRIKALQELQDLFIHIFFQKLNLRDQKWFECISSFYSKTHFIQESRKTYISFTLIHKIIILL